MFEQIIGTKSSLSKNVAGRNQLKTNSIILFSISTVLRYECLVFNRSYKLTRPYTS